LFFRQHPPPAGARILDLGAGWGQLALPLARHHGVQVTALEPTPERLAFIRAAATQEQLVDRLHFVQARFQELEFEPSFDLICCVGVLEWVPKFQPGQPRAVQLEFMRHMRAALRPGGQCCVGIENRFGLKYLLGARDDHTGTRNVSVLDAALAAAKHQALTGQELRAFTYTYPEYEELFQAAGFVKIEAYAAFPDYKLPQLVLPLSHPAALNQALLENPIPPEHDGLDGHLLPDPEHHISHYRSLARMGLAQYFCPSFFFLLR
jgi:SAM-dependent methyltransferase